MIDWSREAIEQAILNEANFAGVLRKIGASEKQCSC